MPKALTCAVCSKAMSAGSGSKPQGLATCQPCRRTRIGNACEVFDCGELVKCRNFCNRHYQQLLAGRSPHAPAPIYRPSDARCVVCGEQFIPKPGGTRANKCQAHTWWKRVSCATCGRSIYRNNRRPRMYCSEGCKPEPEWVDGVTAKAAVVHINWRQCPCGQWICRPRRTYCEPCRVNGVRLYRTCRRCESPIPHQQWKMHCDPCLIVVKREMRRRRRQRYGNKDRHRAKKFGVKYEPVNRQRVYERDKWRCGICRKRVDRTRRWPDRMCASLDHVVPLAHGGEHTYANTQCAHWLCNTLKSDGGGGEQLALTG